MSQAEYKDIIIFNFPYDGCRLATVAEVVSNWNQNFSSSDFRILSVNVHDRTLAEDTTANVFIRLNNPDKHDEAVRMVSGRLMQNKIRLRIKSCRSCPHQNSPEYYDYHASLGLIECFCNLCVKPQTGPVSTSKKETTSHPATTSTPVSENPPAYQISHQESKSCQAALGDQASIDQHLKDAAEILHLRDEIR